MPTRGIERWLSQQLANVLGRSGDERGDGICANVAFPFPGSLTGDALCAASGVDPRLDPWAPQRAVWPLLEVIDRHRGEPWLRTVHDHLGGPSGDATMRARRYGTARHLTDLFDRYSVHRPAMVAAWAAGDDVDGDGRPLPPDLAWQAELWRRLREHLGRPSPAERLGPALAALRDDPALLTLPRRLALFGITRLAPSVLRVVDAIAAHRDVHLMLLHPSPVLWDRVDNGDVAAADARNPLLTTWGRDARELQLALAQSVDSFQSVHLPGAGGGSTLLHALQAGVRGDRPLPAVRGPGAADARAVLRRRGPQRPGALVPRSRPPGRGGARRAAAPVRRRPDTRASRRHRDVPGHRVVRAADRGDVRRGRAPAVGRRHRPARPARRSLAASDQPPPRGARRAARPRLGTDHLDAAARLRVVAAGAPAVPARRRRAGTARGLGDRHRHPLGARRGAPAPVRPRRPRASTRGAAASTGSCSVWR